MRINDRVIGALAICAGVALFIGTLGFREVPGQQLGSAFFPRLLAVALAATGVAFLLSTGKGPLVERVEMLKGRAGLQVLAVLASVLIWVWLSPLLGFIATTALLIASLALLSGGARLASIGTGVGMAIVLHVVFSVLLRVPLPRGFAEELPRTLIDALLT